MEITKYKNGEILFQIRHDMRELPAEKVPGNEAINPELTPKNYSLVDRGKTAKEVNQYRKNLEKEIFSYKRKDVVHDIEYVIQCPADCPPEEKEAFFQACYDYTVSTLPMGEKCVFMAQVHRDEKHRVTGPDGIERIVSKDHIHIHALPAVKDGKHKDKNGNIFEYRLCADQLTKRARLKEFHPGLQKYLDDHRIHATVYHKKEGDGKAVPLSVKQLKEISAKTGIVLDHSLTVDELSQIINTNVLKEKQIEELKSQVAVKDLRIGSLEKTVSAQKISSESVSKNKDQQISKLQDKVSYLEKRNEFLKEKNSGLQRDLHENSVEKDRQISGLRSQIKYKDQQISDRDNLLSVKDQQITEIKENSSKNSTHAARLEGELHDKESQITDLKHQVNVLTEKIDILKSDLHDKDGEIKEIKAAGEASVSVKTELEEKIAELEKQIQTKDTEISELKEKNISLEKDISQVEEKASHSVSDKEVEQSPWNDDHTSEWGSSKGWGSTEKTWDKDVTW